MDKYAEQRYVVRPGSVRGTRGEGTRWAAAAASSLLLASLLLALALPSALGHEVDPIAEFCGAMPNDGNPDQGRVGQGQPLKITTLGSGFFTAIVAADPYDQWRQYMPGDAVFCDLQDLIPGMSVWIRATAAASWNLLGEW